MLRCSFFFTDFFKNNTALISSKEMEDYTFYQMINDPEMYSRFFMKIRGLGPENYIERSMVDNVISEAGLVRRDLFTTTIPPKSSLWDSL